MSADVAFRDLIARVRKGDQGAATDLVRLYEPEIKRAIRVRFTDRRYQRTVDSVDICQSVFSNFFVRLTAGQYDLDHPEDLLKLLVRMARNRIIDQYRRNEAKKRDVGRIEPAGQEQIEKYPGSGETPSQEVALKELLEKLNQILTEEERRLVELRRGGSSWDEIAAVLGHSAEALRKRHERLIERLGPQFGLFDEEEPN